MKMRIEIGHHTSTIFTVFYYFLLTPIILLPSIVIIYIAGIISTMVLLSLLSIIFPTI